MKSLVALTGFRPGNVREGASGSKKTATDSFGLPVAVTWVTFDQGVSAGTPRL
jgi:hypothetical protein